LHRSLVIEVNGGPDMIDEQRAFRRSKKPRSKVVRVAKIRVWIFRAECPVENIGDGCSRRIVSLR
jgi:hypothetical protein